ncbi:MAG: 2-oxoacid:acceptor oxidoreductase family protein [Syntrophomonadaceae bacterium]|nr:2-oxoacid:acceptor oxidoreductase family protein [Syntrophomonadaceae bacterium]
MAREIQVFIAGFGGQGVLAIGKFLAYAAMEEGKNVTWVPSYGAEMRGGTANCLVTIGDDEVSSPLTEHPGTAIIMNRPSLDKFEDKIRSKGTVVLNTSLVDRLPKREDLNVIKIPVNQLAEEINNPRGANMILLGAYLQKTQILEMSAVMDKFDIIFEGKKANVIEQNRIAFQAGVEYAVGNL